MSSPTTKLRWALAASLGLNLFFAGYLVARTSETRRDSTFEGRRPNVTLRRMFRQQREVLVPLRRSVRDAHSAARAELERDPLNETALREALRALRTARNNLAAQMHDVVADVARELPQAERTMLLGPAPGARRK